MKHFGYLSSLSPSLSAKQQDKPQLSLYFPRVTRCCRKNEYARGIRSQFTRMGMPQQPTYGIYFLCRIPNFSIILTRWKMLTLSPLFTVRYHIIQRHQPSGCWTFHTPTTRTGDTYVTQVRHIFSLYTVRSFANLHVASSKPR